MTPISLIALADAVLPLIRSNARDLYRWQASNEQGNRMHEGVNILQVAIQDPETLPAAHGVAVPSAKETYQVTHKALASAIRVIARADDSSGIIGAACVELIALHPRAAAVAQPPALKLADWMYEFHFDDQVDYFNLDPVVYAPALGRTGVARLREHVETLRALVSADPDPREWSRNSFLLSWFDQRFAVLDKDVDAIIRTHVRDGRVAAWFEQTARALAEIDRPDLAIEWARQAMDATPDHQARKASGYWWELLSEHTPDELPDAAWTIFVRWPGSGTAARLEQTVGLDAREEILNTLRARPSDLVHYLIDTLGDVQAAWDAAHRHGLDSSSTWIYLAKAYEKIDPLAAVAVHLRGVEASLARANTRAYRPAARELVRLRTIAVEAGDPTIVDDVVADLRERYRRRPSLIDALDAARLP